jgi:hypothetical protein
LFYLPLAKRGPIRDTEPVIHAMPIRQITGLAAGIPNLAELSAASRAAQAHGLLKYFESPQHVLEILFEGPSDMRFDLRSALPLVFRSAAGVALQK